MAERIPAPPDFLKRFRDPLWSRLEYERVSADNLVESEHRGYEVIVVELQHCRTGLFAKTNSGVENSNFFIIKLQEPGGDKTLTRTPSGYQVSHDNDYVYLTRVGKKVPVKEWRQVLDLAVDAAESLRHLDKTTQHIEKPSRSWNIWDRRWTLFVLAMAGLPAVIALNLFFDELYLYRYYGYIYHCVREGTAEDKIPYIIAGDGVFRYLGMMSLPMIGALNVLRIVLQRYGRPGYAWRLFLGGVFSFALSLYAIVFVWAIFPNSSTSVPGINHKCYGTYQAPPAPAPGLSPQPTSE